MCFKKMWDRGGGRVLYLFNFLYVNVGKLIVVRKKSKNGMGGGREGEMLMFCVCIGMIEYYV